MLGRRLVRSMATIRFENNVGRGSGGVRDRFIGMIIRDWVSGIGDDHRRIMVPLYFGAG
jgi:hypothetical protein